MKILLINQVFVSPEEPGHTRHFEMGKYLKDRGHELVIVASDLNYQTGQRTVARRGLYAEQSFDGVRVLRSYIYPAIHRSYFWRVIAFFSFMFSSIWTALRVRDVDLIIGTTPPIFQAVSAWLVAVARRKPFLLEVRDLWPEFGIGMGVLKNPVIIGLSRWLEAFLYKRATHILVNSPAYRDYMLAKGVSGGKVTCIPYGTDVEMFNPSVDGSFIRRELNLEDKFVVLYAGALGQANDMDTLLRAAQRLKPYDKIHFVVFGDGKERARLEAEAKNKNLSNVLFAGARPKKDMPRIVASADLCLAILQNIPAFRTTYPNKVFDYMAAGRASLIVIDGITRELIESARGGVYVQPADDAMLAQKILELSQNPALVKEMGANAREYLVENLDRRNKLNETLILLEKLTKA
ncbi:MAG: glycosyltransferase WbuB [Chloroflexi bacterium]|nr:glycosyltransferase WbuB [Chloroflexi bacterium CFX1]MCK6567914.1 glycosyltransferase family 4 protein [Anaerolineales bacterium]MCQ3954691.1 glycosyltransferase WbuB [Chloroflexota bacterium]MDL1920163.1 glycosyltransferase family 4 protein [Chloroflexi bacterium CFX5]RIK51621.1 MAG: glycosyltransferase WbuB [Chloroflexota bacterium]